MKKRGKDGKYKPTIEPCPCAHCGTIFRPPSVVVRHCSKGCADRSRIGKPNPSAYRAARTIVNGYVFVRDTERRRAIGEHRVVMEKILGRKLRSGEIVHHINHDRTDNRPENLKLMPNQGAHIREHAVKGPCVDCGKQLNVEVRHLAHGLCRSCFQKRYRAKLRAMGLSTRGRPLPTGSL